MKKIIRALVIVIIIYAIFVLFEAKFRLFDKILIWAWVK